MGDSVVGKGPCHGVPHMAARKWETLFIIYTHNGAASASRATKAGREGGTGSPAPWLRSSAVFNLFRELTNFAL